MSKPKGTTVEATPKPFSAWKSHHRMAIYQSLKSLWANPIATWITLGSLAIALSLPSSLYLLVQNLKTLADDKREVPTLTVFMTQSADEQRTRDTAELIEGLSQVESVEFVPREKALDSFQNITGFENMLDKVKFNPLPHALIITPKLNYFQDINSELREFAEHLDSYAGVDSTQIDLEWVQKLQQVMSLSNRVIIIVGSLLSLTVLLVVGNTIRVSIESRQEEIGVQRLIGAPNHYIRRPFLWGGFWLGLFGGIISLAIVYIVLWFFAGPVNQLQSLSGAQYSLTLPTPDLTLALLALSCILGWIGAWLAVGRHLRMEHPQK